VRFAISAVAAASGLLLLGLSFYGQPAVYLHLAGQQWDALMDRPSEDQSGGDQSAADQRGGDQPAAPDGGQSVASNAQQPAARDDDAANERAAQLQQEVTRLQQQLAARQQVPAAPAQPAAPAAAPPSVVASAPPAAADTTPPTMVVTAAPAPSPPAAVPVPDMAQTAPPSSSGTQAAVSSAAPPASTAPTPMASTAQAPMPTPPVPVQERREASLDTMPPRAERQPDQAKPEAAKPEPTKSEPKAGQVRTESPKVEPPRPAASRVVVQKAIPAPPPLPQSAPPRQGVDDAQSVLARLRQIAPGAPPVQQADASPSPDRPRPAPSPSLPRLSAARNALASGQIDEARRLLQQAQLQLVFGPVDSPNDDTQVAGKGAADVAHALDALSANDVALSRRYVDVAMGDLSGAPVSPPIQESSRRASGYAPAYPPR
jgi:hypothetical protein